MTYLISWLLVLPSTQWVCWNIKYLKEHRQCKGDMPSVFEFMENPEIYVYETTLTNNPDILYAVIDYISLNPNPMLQNEQECYVYPSKAADILSLGTTYRALITKRTRKNHKTDEDETYYPHLDKLFRNVVGQTNIEESLLGYLNKVLVSLAKKTP